MPRWLSALSLGAAVAGVGYWRRALTIDGALGAVLVGAVAFGRGGWTGAAALLSFFGLSSALSRSGEQRKRASPLAQAKGAQRDVWQVVANGGIATLCMALGSRSGYLGALAAAAADTWATELGLLARRQPRLVTTLQPVAPGTSGGITPEGLAGSGGGALSVGLAWTLAGGGRAGLPIALIAGLCGSLVDSLLGATLQALYWCPTCAVHTEEPAHPACGEPAQLVRGYAWVTNDTVNALATLAGAATAVRLARNAKRGGARQGRG
jgi:uncharacterized protein (TIGR00297 family)